MILQCHKIFDRMGAYDPETRTLVTFSRSAAPERVPDRIAGHFGYVGTELVLLFRLNGLLYIEIGGQRLRIDKHHIERRSVNGRWMIRISYEGKTVVEWTYAGSIGGASFLEDPTPFVEEEQFDFGLFVANVALEPARQNRLYVRY